MARDGLRAGQCCGYPDKGSYEGNGENGESDDRRTSNDPTHDTLRTRQQFSQMTLMFGAAIPTSFAEHFVQRL